MSSLVQHGKSSHIHRLHDSRGTGNGECYDHRPVGRGGLNPSLSRSQDGANLDSPLNVPGRVGHDARNAPLNWEKVACDGHIGPGQKGIRWMRQSYARRAVSVRFDANAATKVVSLIAGMVAAADSMSDMDLLRHGGMGRLCTGV
jgi:hypothetical protein